MDKNATQTWTGAYNGQYLEYQNGTDGSVTNFDPTQRGYVVAQGVDQQGYDYYNGYYTQEQYNVYYQQQQVWFHPCDLTNR
jgi:hypothetical protein